MRRRRESEEPANERHLLCYVAATPASPSVSASECWQTPPSCRRDWGQTATEHLLWKSWSTTEASASVETSPRSRSSQATFRRRRRMIFPGERPGLDWRGGASGKSHGYHIISRPPPPSVAHIYHIFWTIGRTLFFCLCATNNMKLLKYLR